MRRKAQRKLTSVGGDVEALARLTRRWGACRRAAAVENGLAASQYVRQSDQMPRQVRSGYILKRTGNRCSNKCLATDVYSSEIHNCHEENQPKCPSAGEQINTVWALHTMQSHSAIRGNEALAHATTWVNLENVLMKAARYQRLRVVKMPLTGHVQGWQIQGDSKHISGWGGEGEEE